MPNQIQAKFICIEDEGFYQLIDEVVARIKSKNDVKEDEWISATETMKKLRITSRGTLQNLRDQGSIEYTKLSEKHILYSTKSINQYLEKHAQKTF